MSEAKILVIDDNPLNIELVKDLLNVNGFRVYAAENAETGIRLARELSPHLVLMDIGLPGMDGICATRTLRADPSTQFLKIVGLTAQIMEGDEADALHHLFDGWLQKPFDIINFVQAIKEFVGTHE